MLHLAGIRKRFGPTVALDGVDIELRRGEVHALIGENGAGKSTLMNVVAGAFAADGGTMTLDGAPYAPASPLDAYLNGILAKLLAQSPVKGVPARAYVRASGDWAAKTTADANIYVALGVRGSVRNLPDGRVEVVAFGRKSAVAALLEFCARGPRGARVDRVDVEELAGAAGRDFNGFQIRR